MTVVGVICEYNLFHSGHARLISAIKERFGEDTAVVSLMSGSFTQRGIPAATDKYIRAHAALMCGSDLTVELPVPHSMSVAENFAAGAVALFSALGCIDYLAFGSECGDVEALSLCASRMASVEFEGAFAAALASAAGDESYIKTRERVYAALYGDMPLLPNDQLGVEYLRALVPTGIKPAVFKRTGHESATASRAAFLAGDEAALAGLVPECAHELYKSAPKVSEEHLSRAVLAFLRLADPKELSRYAGMNTDIAHRAVHLAGKCSTLEQFYSECATKKYTKARIRRGVLSAILGITDGDCRARPEYTLVLSASGRGCELLKQMRKVSSVPVYDKGAQVASDLAARADALYTLAYEDARCAGELLRKSPVIWK